MRGSEAQEKTVRDAPMGHAPPLPDDLRAALAEGRVTAHYQPIVDIRRGRIMQLEALARWVDPDRGSIPPSDFIPLAERSGLIGTITTLMIERALLDLAVWRARVPGLRVAVNLSADSFAEPQLPDVIGRALTAAGCEAGCLGLEITESVLMKRPEQSQGHVERLRALGVRVAIDDFGIGYSSLKYLQLLPVDEIKIDRQFIETSVDDRNSQVIVRSVIALCHELGFGVVAEGVADRDVWDLLAALSCDSAQGYFVAKPMPPEAVGPWIEDWQRTRPAAHPATPANGERREKPLILIVDDEPTIVSLLEGVLGERGYRVSTALNGQEALEAVARDRPSLVLLEIHVPIIGGEGFVTELVARRIDVPVVAMTAGPIAARWARKMGVQGSLAKPFSIMELLAAVERLATVN